MQSNKNVFCRYNPGADDADSCPDLFSSTDEACVANSGEQEDCFLEKTKKIYPYPKDNFFQSVFASDKPEEKVNCIYIEKKSFHEEKQNAYSNILASTDSDSSYAPRRKSMYEESFKRTSDISVMAKNTIFNTIKKSSQNNQIIQITKNPSNLSSFSSKKS